MKRIKWLIALALLSVGVQAQKTFTFEGKQMEAVHVTTAIEKIKGKKALRIERDLQQLPFDAQRIGETTDGPTFVKLVFVVKETLGNTPSGGIGLWVDIGTIGYFRDIKITKK